MKIATNKHSIIMKNRLKGLREYLFGRAEKSKPVHDVSLCWDINGIPRLISGPFDSKERYEELLSEMIECDELLRELKVRFDKVGQKIDDGILNSWRSRDFIKYLIYDIDNEFIIFDQVRQDWVLNQDEDKKHRWVEAQKERSIASYEALQKQLGKKP